jgi:DNA polymerase-3 subunit delta
MKVDLKKIHQSLDKNQPFPIYFLYGEEPYFIDEVVKRIETGLLSEEEKAFNQTVLYGKDIDFKTVLDYAKRFPVFAERQVVIIKEAQELKDMDKLEPYFDKPVPSTVLVFAHKHKKPDGRKSYFKKISDKDKNPEVAAYESEPIKDAKLADWIEDYLKDKKLSFGSDVPQLLADLLGNDLSKIVNEVAKLEVLKQNLNADLVREHIGMSKDFNVFELQNALGQRNVEKAMLIARYFASNLRDNPLIGTISILIGFYQRLWVMRSMEQSKDEEIAAALGLDPKRTFLVRMQRPQSRNYTLAELEMALHWLNHYDLRAKGVNTIDGGSEEGDATPHEALTLELIYRLVQRGLPSY